MKEDLYEVRKEIQGHLLNIIDQLHTVHLIIREIDMRIIVLENKDKK